MFSKLFRRSKGARESQPQPTAAGPRRREHERFACRLPLRARCSSWGSFHDLFSGNLSERGLFIPADELAGMGEAIEVELVCPDGRPLRLKGRVVHVFPGGEGRPRGLGVQLLELGPEDDKLYHSLVEEAARQVQVKPAPEALGPAQGGLFGPAAAPRAAPPLVPPQAAPPLVPPQAAAPLVPPPARRPGPPLPPRRPTPPPPPVVPARSSVAAEPSDEEQPASGEIPIFVEKEPSPPPRPPGAAAHAPVVGIDFGTSMSSLAMVRDGVVHLLRTATGRFELPSVVAFDGDRVLVGEPACERLLEDPRRAIASPKRLLGRDHDDRELEPFLATLAMPHGPSGGGEILLRPNGRVLKVEEVCAPILAHLRELAERELGQPIRQAVLTVPVSFDRRRCDALRVAAALAGLDVLATVDEPTAAVLPCAGDPGYRNLVAVYDLGGGTFDFSVVDVSAADIQVVATAGDTWLGGDDLDEALAGAAANAFWRQHKIELRHQAVQWQRLRVAAERTKRELSVQEQAVVTLPEAALTRDGPLRLEFAVTRPAFSELIAPIVERSLDTCREALALCDLAPSQLQAVYLSGGSSNVPAVREAVARFFGAPPRSVVPPERAVVMGAAIFAARHLAARIGGSPE